MSTQTAVGAYLVIDKLLKLASDTEPRCQILEQSDKHLCSYYISMKNQNFVY